MKWIEVTEFGKYRYKTSHSEDDPWHSVTICRHQNSASTIELLKPRQSGNVIKQPKLKDISKQLPFIPEVYRGYYEKVIQSHQQTSNSVPNDALNLDMEDSDADDCQVDFTEESSSSTLSRPQCKKTEVRILCVSILHLPNRMFILPLLWISAYAIQIFAVTIHSAFHRYLCCVVNCLSCINDSLVCL